MLAVPSFSTLQSLRKSIIENGNTCPLTQKHIVQLDWVSKEDGSHILTVAVGSKVIFNLFKYLFYVLNLCNIEIWNQFLFLFVNSYNLCIDNVVHTSIN